MTSQITVLSNASISASLYLFLQIINVDYQESSDYQFVKDVKTQWRFVLFSFLYWNFSISRTENRSFSRHFAKLKLSCLYLVSDEKEALKPKWTSSTLPRPSSSVI